MGKRRLLTLLTFYSARSHEYVSKGILSYLVWTLLIGSSAILYGLHRSDAVGGTSQYMVVFPYVLLALLGTITYINFKLKALYFYLIAIELAISKLLDPNSPLDRDWREISEEVQFPVPLWALPLEPQKGVVRSAGSFRERRLPRIVEFCAALFGLGGVIGTALMGFDYLANRGEIVYPQLSPNLFFIGVLAGVLIVGAMHFWLANRLRAIERERLFSRIPPRDPRDTVNDEIGD